MNKVIRQNFERVQARLTRLVFVLGGLSLLILLLVETTLLVKGRSFDFTILGLFAGALVCGGWLYRKAQLKIRQQSLTTWSITEKGLEWNDPLAGSGTFLWDEIMEINHLGNRLELQCRKAQSQGGTGHQLRFSLFLEKEDASELRSRWESAHSKSI